MLCQRTRPLPQALSLNVRQTLSEALCQVLCQRVPTMVLALTLVLGAASVTSFPSSAQAAETPNPAQTSEADAAKSPNSKNTVTLYRSGARMEQTQSVSVERGIVRFVLPPGTDLQSLDVRVAGHTVHTVEAQTMKAPDSPAMSQLREQLRKARAENAVTQGEVEANKARITFWEKPTTTFKLSVELEKTDALMQEKLAALFARRAGLDEAYDKTRENVAFLEQRLSDMGDATLKEQHVVVRVSPETSGSAQLTLGYFLSNCGWNPIYTLNALTEKGIIELVQSAEIEQSTGRDWTGYTLILSSGLPQRAVSPAPLRPWRIEPVRIEPRVMAMESADMVSPPNQMKMAARAAAPRVDVREEATSTLWDLGIRTIEAGMPTRLELGTAEWKADFVRVVRPSKGNVAFLMAEVNLPEAVSMANSQGRFMVNGATVGTAPFSFNGTTEKLFFGIDPRVTATMKQDARQSGEKGFIGKQQTRNWSWSVDVVNAHSSPVAVRLEDPEPQLGDTAITLNVSSSPKPESLEHAYVWKLTVPANGKSVVKHAVTASAPADMRLIESR